MLNENDKEPAMYSITAESAHHPDILALITALDRYQRCRVGRCCFERGRDRGNETGLY